MRPAENRDLVTYSNAVLYGRYMVGGEWSEWASYGDPGTESYWDRSIYPATTVNPVQPDGSRARSAWSNRWATSSIPSRNILVENDTPWGDKYEFKILHALDPLGGILQSVGFVSPFIASGGDFPISVENAARTRFLKKLSGSVADLGVALAEMRSTVNMVEQLSRGVLRGLDKAVSKGRGLPRKVVREILNFGKLPPKRPGEASRAYRRRVSRERAVLNAWLTTQFGLIPLVNDIDQIGRGLSDMLFEQALPMRLTITSGAKSTIQGTGSDDFGAIASVRSSVRGEAEYMVHISADYDIPLSASRTWNQWGMSNPAVVAWELTQFSWMVDYAIQVGDWLETLTAANGTTPLGGSISYLAKLVSLQHKLDGLGTYKVLQPQGWQDTSFSNIGCFQRSLVSDVIPASLPSVRNKVNMTRLANVLAVLASRARL